MQKQLIECVPNFSEGLNMGIIDQITAQIKSVDGVHLLDVDPGKATNRTVVTFVGEPEAVINAAFLAIKKASKIIDMSKHKGEHPRMGATDVCPLIPVANISMADTAQYAQKLAKRVGEELQLPIYLYEEAQANKKRSNLSVIRAGEYEGFATKITQDDWKPDFGPAVFNPKTGVTAIGAREFLIAYNINLNTKSTRIANRIAFDVREAGRVKRNGHPVSGDIEMDANGEAVRIPGKLKQVKAIGWFIEEYNRAQISMNLTNYKITPLHVAFDATCDSAAERGARVTGSELVGLIPLQAMLDAGKYFLEKQELSSGVSEAALIDSAIHSLGLSEISPFDPQKKIIEYQLQSIDDKKLASMSLEGFVDETASDSPAPGGGSIAAAAAAMGVALGTMVANLSANKFGWENKVDYYSQWAQKGQKIKEDLLRLVDEDTRAFNAIMATFAMPKDSEQDKAARNAALESASKNAMEIPYKTMQAAANALPLLDEMCQHGNPNSLSDVGVGALCIKTGVHGAYLNVLINAGGIKDKAWANNLVAQASDLLKTTINSCDSIVQTVEEKIKAS
jgi:glutamate formiminotransferase / formiminotetrahydrofolate cyclodeaminase